MDSTDRGEIKSMKVVVVEDEIRIREGLCKLLEKMFPEIEVVGSAENGKEGLLCIRKHNPALVITDIKMPVMDGLEMLKQMQQEGLYPKVIVLSAYSEFSYAQQAVRLGVNDYLIKPVVVQEFVQIIRKIQNLCEQEEKRTPEAMGSLENIMSGIIHGTSTIDVSMEEFLLHKYQIQKDTPILELLVYMGDAFERGHKRKRQELEILFQQEKRMKYCFVELEYDRTILVLLYGYKTRQEIERWYQNRILLQKRDEKESKISYGMLEINGIAELREGYHKLVPYMDWNIVLGDDVLVSYPKVAKVQTEVCIYPVDLENQLKIAICAGEREKIKKIVNKFEQYFISGIVYSPKEIKESYVRFLWAFLNIAKEVNRIDYKEVDQRVLLDQIMSAKTYYELQICASELIEKIGNLSEESGKISLPVKKAQSMIHEFYADGITLAEIADRLNMTQEYLGNQFHKELGENFSSYIRNYRLGKAKELLIGTQLKQYEIAERVGYTDAKYFARVFKECTGMSPAEYRKSHR